MQPWWLDWTAGFFPVILVVFLLRSFLFEPFKIPSGSMMPDAAGRRPDPGQQVHLRHPPAGHQHEDLTDGTPPQRGDVMVFRYPPKPELDYIKRVVGVPGDEVAYLNKQLTINGQPVPQAAGAGLLRRRRDALPQAVFARSWAARQHRLLNDDPRRAGLSEAEIMAFPIRRIAATVTRA